MFKRAVVAPVFKYIFVLVAGGLILLFFVKFAMDMVGTKERVATAELGFVIDDSLAALSVSEDQSQPIPNVPWPSSLELSFGKGSTCGKFSSGSFNYPSSKVVFSPSKLKGEQVYAWTQTWYYPFKIDNFFFLTSKRSKYYLVYPASKDVADFVKGIDSVALPTDTLEHFPKSFEVESISLDQVVPKYSYSSGKYDFVKFVFFNTAPNTPSGARYVRVDYVDCESDRDDGDCRGKVAFPTGTSFFVGKPMLYGAILAEDLESYNCQLSKIYRHWSIILDLYDKKADLLSLKNPSCQWYGGVKSNINSMKSLVGVSVNYDEFHTKKGDLINSNNKLGDDSACAALF